MLRIWILLAVGLALVSFGSAKQVADRRNGDFDYYYLVRCGCFSYVCLGQLQKTVIERCMLAGNGQQLSVTITHAHTSLPRGKRR
jgi:hypothetical protein